jgi:hypothetical protein
VEKGKIPHTIQRRKAKWMGHTAFELLSKTQYSRKDRRDGKMRKKTKAATE